MQCDDIWSFCYAKQNNVPADKQGQFGDGDVWTWTALCADTKLVPCWMIGGRDAFAAYSVMQDLSERLAHRTESQRMYSHLRKLPAKRMAYASR